MNQAILAMMPKMIDNSTQQSNQPKATSTVKFDDILNNTLSNQSKVVESNLMNTDVTTEQKKIIEDLLAFLGMDNFSEMEDGNLGLKTLVENALLQALMIGNGEDEVCGS